VPGLSDSCQQVRSEGHQARSSIVLARTLALGAAQALLEAAEHVIEAPLADPQ
jgi:Tfp pilus assembly protein PilX